MTRIMGDSIHANVHKIPLTVNLVAGYDTGTPDIKWITEDWNLFPNIPHIHIDQGFGDSRAAEAHVIVFDVETNAFKPSQAGDLITANRQLRPTIYVDRFNLHSTIASALTAKNWKGDIWLAYPGWQPEMSLPPLPPGCHFVAVQNNFANAYDLSMVLDDSWPGTPPPAPTATWTEEVIKELPTIAPGATGLFVRRIQALCVADALAINIDGQFGMATKNAVMTIQRKAALTVDGIVGQQTWPVLLGV